MHSDQVRSKTHRTIQVDLSLTIDQSERYLEVAGWVGDLDFGQPVVDHIRVEAMAYDCTVASVTAGLEVVVKVPCNRRLAAEEQVMRICRTAVAGQGKLSDRIAVAEVGVQAMRTGRMAAELEERGTQIGHMMVEPASAGRARRDDHRPEVGHFGGRIHSFRSRAVREPAADTTDESDKMAVEVVDTMDTVVPVEAVEPVDHMAAAAPAVIHHRIQTTVSAS